MQVSALRGGSVTAEAKTAAAARARAAYWKRYVQWGRGQCGPCDQYLMKRGLQTDSWSDDRNGSAGNTGGASATNGAASGTGWAGAQAEGLVLIWGRDPEAFETLWDYKLGA